IDTLSSNRRGSFMESAYRVIAGLIALGVVVQAASVAYAAFSLSHAVDDGATLDKNSKVWDAGFIVHSLDGQVIIPLLAIALLVVSFRAGVPDGRRWAGFVFLAVAVSGHGHTAGPELREEIRGSLKDEAPTNV